VLLYRFLTALVAGPLVVLLVILGPPWGFPLLALLIGGVGLYEYFSMTLPGPESALVRYASLVLTAAWATLAVSVPGSLAIAGLMAAAIALMLVHLARPGAMDGAGARMAGSLGGLLYVALPIAHLCWLHGRQDGWRWVMLVFFVVWVGDTSAYFGGRAIGGPKLYPAVSPGKTIAGAVSGLVGSVAVAFLARAWFHSTLSAMDCLVVGVAGGVLGQLGDLVESIWKRSAGVKDSGRFFPGHGGVLDRVDALLFATPFVYWYALWVAPLG